MLLHAWQTTIEYKHNFYMWWKSKTFVCLSLLWYLLYFGGLEPNPRYLQCALVLFFPALSLPSSFKSVSWEIIDFDRVDWDYLASGRGIYLSFVVVNCSSLVKAGLLQMFIIVHRKDTWLCPCERVRESETHTERKKDREGEKVMGRILFHGKNNSKRCY